jgi:hypothetical protein
VLRRRLAKLKEELGVDTRLHHAAMSDAKVILTTRIRWLVANKTEFIISRTANKVPIELLGDACGIFKRSKVHGTSIMLKTIYNTSGLLKQASTVDKILYRRCGVNTVENCTLLSFLGVGDDKFKHIEENLPPIAAVVSELMSEEGLEVDGVKYTLKVTFGGKP